MTKALRYLLRVWMALAVILGGIVGVLVTPANHAFAIDQPDSTPQINEVTVFNLTDGGTGILIDYVIDYAVLPTETATEAYLFSFVDTDGTTLLKTTSPYAFTDSGYGRGNVWIQFTATETATYALDSADVALYSVTLVGNPTLTWGGSGAPPAVSATIDTWNTTGDPKVLLASKIKYYADQLELAWSLDLIEATAVGARLTTTGENYFSNVIPDIRTLAPSALASTTSDPTPPSLDYRTAFGAVMANGTGNVTGSPITLSEGSNTVNVTSAGTFTIVLTQGTIGTMTDGTGTVTGSPIDLVRGTNTVTVTAPGTFTLDMELSNTQTKLRSQVTGTGLDTGSGWGGLSGEFWSGLVWFALTIVACVVYLGAESKRQPEGYDFGGSRGKGVLLIFDIMIIAGSVMGLLTLLATIVLIIAFGVATGYVFFFKQGTTDKGVMFAIWVWFLISLGGNIWIGGSPAVATTLDADLSASGTTITVASTTGFPDQGELLIGNEVIYYPTKTSTTFQSSALGINPTLRGQENTTASAHTEGDIVRTKEASYLNASLDYKLALLTDSAGIMAFVTIPLRLLDLIITFFTPSFGYLGGGLQFLTFLWSIVSIGLLVGLWLQLAGGRRV